MLSLVIPVYKKEKLIKEFFHKLNATLSRTGTDYELIVVIDGSPDGSFEQLDYVKDSRTIVICNSVNHGKGAAFQAGASVARGKYIGFIDCGLDIELTGLARAIKKTKYRYDAIIARKHTRNEKWHRKLISSFFNAFRKALFDLEISDTQTGLKLFRRDVLQSVTPFLNEKRWLFDIEILLWLKALGWKKICEVKVNVNHLNKLENSTSTNPSSVMQILGGMVGLSFRLGRLGGNRIAKLINTK